MKIPGELFYLARCVKRKRQVDAAHIFGVTKQAIGKWEKLGVPEDRVISFVVWLLTDSVHYLPGKKFIFAQIRKTKKNNKKSENPQLQAEGFTEGETNGPTPRS